MSTSALTGRVTSGGNAVANATITAASPALQQPRVTLTSASGTYWLGALPPGEYEVTFARQGLQTLTRRAVVELARIARADAQLEPSEDEESVTSTVTTISVVHDTALTTYRNTKALDRLPVPITLFSGSYLAPAAYSFFPMVELDGSPMRVQFDVLQSETAESTTFVRGITPMEYARGSDSAFVTRTRSGGEELSVSIRDTISSNDWLGDAFGNLPDDGVQHFLETTSGGRILSNRLWFFGAGWGGERAIGGPRDTSGFQLKLTAQLGDHENVMATYTDSQYSFNPSADFGLAFASLVHTAQWGPRILSEIATSRQTTKQSVDSFPSLNAEHHALSAKASAVAGNHLLSGGIDYENGDFGDLRSLFVSDRFWHERWVVNAGVRYLDGVQIGGYNPGGPQVDREPGWSAQIAAAYDLRGRGRNALTASATRYTVDLYEWVDELTLGYVMALGSTGSARLNILRKEHGDQLTTNSLQLDSSYRLFDRFEAGLNYTYTDVDTKGFASPFLAANIGNIWFSAEIPISEQAFGVMVAYRYQSAYEQIALIEDEHAVDLALRYTIPIRRVALTLAADVLNVFDQGSGFQYPRVGRGWIRVRL